MFQYFFQWELFFLFLNKIKCNQRKEEKKKRNFFKAYETVINPMCKEEGEECVCVQVKNVKMRSQHIFGVSKHHIMFNDSLT